MNRSRAVWAHFAYRELKRRRQNAARALDMAELTELAVLDEEGWIPFNKEVQFFEAAAEISGDDCFGVHLVSKIDVRKAGLLAYIGLSAPTLEDAYLNFSQYLKVHNAAMHGELVNDGPRVRLRVSYLDPDLLKYKQREEMGAALDLHVARWLTQRDLKLVEASFVHDRRENRNEVERVLGCPVSFKQPVSETVFHRDDMQLPIPTADRNLLKILTRHAEHVIAERSADSDEFLEIVSKAIIDQLSTGRVTSRRIAGDIGISERTMSRRLAEHDTTFNELMDGIRRDLAMRYLDSEEVKLSELACLLGFSSHAAFSASFKKWTGHTPREARTLS